MYQYAPSHNAVFSGPQFHAVWITALHGRINGGMAIVGQTLYVDSFDKHVYALDARTGHILWKAAFDNVVMSTPIVGHGRVIVGSGRDGFLGSDPNAQIWGRPRGDTITALDWHTGRRVWTFHTLGEDMASPAIYKQRVIFANGDQHVYALDIASGRLVWRKDIPGVATMASTTMMHGHAYIGICHNVPQFRRTLAIDVHDGSTRWSNQNGSCDASASADRGRIFVDGNEERLNTAFDPGGVDTIAAIDGATGKTLWTNGSSPGPYSLVASGEHAIAGTAVDGVLYQSIVTGNAVVALDEATGKELWRVHTAGPVKMSPVVTLGRVVFGDTAGILYRVDRKSGDVLHTTSFKNPFSTSPTIIVGDTLFICNGDSVIALPWDEP